MEIKYYVDILGTIWMPSVQAAQSIELTEKDLERAGYSLPLTHDDAGVIENYVSKHCGDFASIDALRIEKFERVSHYSYPNADGWSEKVMRERITTLRDFTEDEFSAWNDCMYADEGNEE